MFIAELEGQLVGGDSSFVATGGPSRLAWLRRCQAGHRVQVACLGLGRARILHLRGELFVEYQLAAKAARLDFFVAMAAYEDFAPWDVGTIIGYEEGGYETSPAASNVAPAAEEILWAQSRNCCDPIECRWKKRQTGCPYARLM